MREKSIAVLGDKDSVLCFKAIGVDVFEADNAEQTETKLKLIARDYKIIYITEDLAALVPELIARYKTRAYPIVTPIPTASGSLGIGMDGIKKDVEKAIGSDILFNKK